MAYVRREFYDLHQAHKSPIAAEALSRIGDSYGIVESIRGKSPNTRQGTRNQHTLPLLDSMYEWPQATVPSKRPKLTV